MKALLISAGRRKAEIVIHDDGRSVSRHLQWDGTTWRTKAGTPFNIQNMELSDRASCRYYTDEALVAWRNGRDDVFVAWARKAAHFGLLAHPELVDEAA